jgi:spore coat protein U-like protein
MRFERRGLFTAALLSAAVVAASLAGPVSAAADGTGLGLAAARQPDGRIRLQKIAYELFPNESYSRPWIGNNVYNTTATGQRARERWFDTTPGWQRWVFGVSIQNDGTSSDRIKVKATGNVLAGWKVKYFRGRTNITSAVVAGTFKTPRLAPGGKYLIKAKVTRAAEGFAGGDLSRLVTLTSVGNAAKQDAVKLVMHEVVCGC